MDKIKLAFDINSNSNLLYLTLSEKKYYNKIMDVCYQKCLIFDNTNITEKEKKCFSNCRTKVVDHAMAIYKNIYNIN